MKKLMLCIVLLVAASKFAFAQSGECPGQHCSAKAAIVNQMCRALGQAGGVVFVEHSSSYCWCKCSCLAAVTPVAIGTDSWKAIGEVKVGETVLALQQDGTWQQAPVVFSDGTSMPEQPYPYAVYVSLENGTSIIVTADHLFLIPDGSLRRADRLTVSDKLVAPDLSPLTITAVVPGSYHGPIHHIATTEWDETKLNKYGHLINTAGVVSADYFAELHLTDIDFANTTLPQIGTAEYEKRTGTNLEALAALFEKTMNNTRAKDALSQASGVITKTKERGELSPAAVSKESIDLGAGYTFTPGKRFTPPEGAIHFLPPGQDTAVSSLLEPLDYTVPYEMAEYLVYHFKRFYPEVVFHIEWYDDRVNAFAWRQGNTRHVAILGGMLRHRYIKHEAAGLVLAHELGHHYGGPPRYTDNAWSSCEGQSDYWGALIAMRNVWWGPYALDQIKAGSQQLYNLFSNGLAAGNLLEEGIGTAAAGLCTHPPALCRLQTYTAALKADSKPTCAGQ